MNTINVKRLTTLISNAVIKPYYFRSRLLSPKPKYSFSRAKWYYAKRKKDKSFAAEFTFDLEQYEWCIKQFGPPPKQPDAWARWGMLSDNYRFRDEKDYMLFILRWA